MNIRKHRPRRMGLLATAAALLLSGCQASFFATVNGIRDNGDSQRVSGELFDSASGLRVDVYRPAKAAEHAPVVIFYYGGSWRSGKRGWYQFVGRALAEQGLVTVIPDYRKFPQVSFQQLIGDAATAVSWVQSQRQLLGSDGPIYLAGHSAGAHIAALLATDPRYLREAGSSTDAVAGLIGFAGPYNFLPIVDPKVAEVFVDDQGAYDAQPIHHVSADSAPALLFHGSADETVRPFNSATFAQALQQAGVRADYREIADMGHIRLVFEIGRDSDTGHQIAAAIAAFVGAPREALAGTQRAVPEQR